MPLTQLEICINSRNQYRFFQNKTTTCLRNANFYCCVSSGSLVENSPQACGFGVDVRSVLDPIWEDVDVTLMGVEPISLVCDGVFTTYV